MKRIAIALLFVLIATGAQAETIYDIQTGLVPVDTEVDLSGVIVTAVRYNGVWVSEAPHAAYNSIWVYGPTDFVAGDILDITDGFYKEYYDLSEIEEIANTVITLVGSGDVPAPIVLFASDLFDPEMPSRVDAEPYESCLVTISNSMTVTDIFEYGQWGAIADDGSIVLFDDYFYDAGTVEVGQCYNNATGILEFSYGDFKLEPLVDGIELVDCTVATEALSFEAVKALYR